MATRLPIPGKDGGMWGNLLNDFLRIEHEVDGSLKLRSEITTQMAAKASLDVESTFTKRLVIIEPGAGATTLQLPDTTGSTGMTFGGDTNLFRSGSGQLQTSSTFFVVRATVGVAGLGVTKSGDATRRFQVNTDGKLLWSAGAGLQDTTMIRDTTGGLKISQTSGTQASPATPALSIVPTGVTSGSPTSGGSVLINQDANPGSGLSVYSTAGTGALGRLVNITASNSQFDQPAMHVSYAGTSNAYEISSTGTGTTGNALNVVSTNPNDSTLGINGAEVGRGTVKIVHNYPGQADASASALSLRANGSGTSAQGIFFDSDTGTSGNLMKFRNAGADKFIMSPNGSLYASQNVQIGATAGDAGGGVGVLGFSQAAVLPAANPTAGGVIMYADQGALKWRDPNGAVYTVGSSMGLASVGQAFDPGDQNYKGWAYDPVNAANNTALVSGQPVLIKVRAAQSGSITTINFNANTQGSGFVASSSYVALYTLGGNRLGQSADVAGSLNTTGAKAITLVAPASVTADAFYYVYIVVNASGMPALNRAGNIGAINQGLGPGSYRFCSLGSGISTPPATVDLSASSALSTSYWAAIS